MAPSTGLRAAAVFIALLLPSTASADTTAVYQSGNGQESVTFAVKGPMVRWDAADLKRRARYALFDSGQGVFMIVDEARKEILELKPEEVRKQREAMQREFAPMMKQLQERMKTMPPEQRRMMEKQMSAIMQAPGAEPKTVFTTEKIGAGTVKGIPCERLTVLKDGKPIQQVCVASPTDAGIPDGDFKTMMMMFDAMREMASAAASAAMPLAADLNGIPIKMTNSADGSVQTLKSISTETLPSGSFVTPAYPKVGFGGVPGRK